MNFRSKHTLEHWLEQFQSTRGGADLAKVAMQDGSDGSDTGLVIVPLRNATTTVYMAPGTDEDRRWLVTIEPQSEATVLECHDLHALAAELLMTAQLCAFMEAKSIGHYEPETAPTSTV